MKRLVDALHGVVPGVFKRPLRGWYLRHVYTRLFGAATLASAAAAADPARRTAPFRTAAPALTAGVICLPPPAPAGAIATAAFATRAGAIVAGTARLFAAVEAGTATALRAAVGALPLPGVTAAGAWDAPRLATASAALAAAECDHDFASTILWVMDPAWEPLATALQKTRAARLVYDVPDAPPAAEDLALLEGADLVLAATAAARARIARTAPAVAERIAADPAVARLRLAAVQPRTSIVLVTWNGWHYTDVCLQSVLRTSEPSRTEIIVVDNASSDATAAELATLAARHSHLRVVVNSANRGFAAANNIGLALATGDILVLLNNDTVVPPGWLPMLAQWLADPLVGLVGPVTNQAGNEARIAVDYGDRAGMQRFATARRRTHLGRGFDIAMLAMFCTAMRREVFAAVGDLDERFELGMFEDDDYARRVRATGRRVVCAEDVFVHHFGGASFATLPPDAYAALFARNRARFESKWGETWTPHRARPAGSRAESRP